MSQFLDVNFNVLLDDEGHKRFDAEVVGLLRYSHSTTGNVACSTAAEKLLDSMVGKLIEAPEQGENGKKWGWKERWPHGYTVRRGWCYISGGGEHQMRRALHMALIELARLVVDGTTPHLQKKYRGQVDEALADYLSLRGCQTTSSDESLSKGQKSVYEAMNQLKAKGQLPARAEPIRLRAGYSSGYVRHILPELVRLNLVVEVKGGYDLK
jgi:hypothetical protein